MNHQIIIKYCDTQAGRKWKVAQSLYKERHYADCLFYCHLTLELLLKSKVVQATKKQFPITHNLSYLAEKSNLALGSGQKKNLREINTFNIAGRYDDYKKSFYNQATVSFTKKYYLITKELISWLKKH